jgi:hypothetical protein
MIDSERIQLRIRTHGTFLLSGEGLELIEKEEGFIPELEKEFNTIYADSTHLTPIESIEYIPDVFMVTEGMVTDVKILSRTPIEAPTQDKIF